MTEKRQPNNQIKNFEKRVRDRAFYEGQRDAGSSNEDNWKQAVRHELLIEEAARNSSEISKGVFDERIGPAVDARIKPKTREIGKVLGEIIGQANEDRGKTKLRTREIGHQIGRTIWQGEENRKKIEVLAEKVDNAAKKADEAMAKPVPKGDKGETGSTGKIPRWMVPAFIGLAALAVVGAYGAYFYSKPEGNNVETINGTPTTGEAAGTPRLTNVISDEKGDSRVVIEPDGRIWQDRIQPGNKPYELSFTMPTTGNMTRIFNGINAQLLEDTDRNGEPDTLVAGGVNGKEVTLTPGGWYKAEGGANNGGFSLEVPTGN